MYYRYCTQIHTRYVHYLFEITNICVGLERKQLDLCKLAPGFHSGYTVSKQMCGCAQKLRGCCRPKKSRAIKRAKFWSISPDCKKAESSLICGILLCHVDKLKTLSENGRQWTRSLVGVSREALIVDFISTTKGLRENHAEETLFLAGKIRVSCTFSHQSTSISKKSHAKA